MVLKHYDLYDFMWARAFATVSLITLVYFGYVLYLRYFENRKPTEYSKKNWALELSMGMGAGAVLIAIQVFMLWILNIYSFSEINVSSGILHILFISMITGFVEELLNKGIIFRILEEGLGSWIALMVVAFEVGLSHMSNAGASTLSTLAVSVEFGVMLVLIYMVTRRLWFVTGFHFAWNFSMGGIFGLNVSGLGVKGLFSPTVEGHELLTGGSFGIEAAIPAIALSSIISCLLMIYVMKNKLTMKLVVGSK